MDADEKKYIRQEQSGSMIVLGILSGLLGVFWIMVGLYVMYYFWWFLIGGAALGVSGYIFIMIGMYHRNRE